MTGRTTLAHVRMSTTKKREWLTSKTVSLKWRLAAGKPQPEIGARAARSGRREKAIPHLPKLAATSTSVRTIQPVPPPSRYGFEEAAKAGPAMSRCTHGFFVDELLQELGGGDRPSRTAPSVLHVGDVAFELLGEVIEHRQLPDVFAGTLGRRQDLVAPRLVVGEDAGDLVAQRHDARAGERRQVDEAVGPLVDRVAQDVGQDEPPLGVCVVDLDRRSARGPSTRRPACTNCR